MNGINLSDLIRSVYSNCRGSTISLPNIWLYKKGGKVSKGESGIHIKPENRGKFTEYCGGKVTSECISRGKNSSDPAVRKRATFAQNARKWDK